MAQCIHCKSETNLSKILCDQCAGKAAQVLPADIKERIQIYKLLQKSDNPIIRIVADQLIKDDYEEVQEAMLDPNDSMFNPRG